VNDTPAAPSRPKDAPEPTEESRIVQELARTLFMISMEPPQTEDREAIQAERKQKWQDERKTFIQQANKLARVLKARGALKLELTNAEPGNPAELLKQRKAEQAAQS